MSDPEADQKQQFLRASAKVGSVVELIDVRLDAIEGSLLNPSPRVPLSITSDVVPTVSRLTDFLIYNVAYHVSLADVDGQDAMRARIVLALLFKVNQTSEIDPNDLLAFASVGAIEIAHPYVREILHSLTGRMGLPPLLLDVKAPQIATEKDD
jgi:hypothetical protein